MALGAAAGAAAGAGEGVAVGEATPLRVGEAEERSQVVCWIVLLALVAISIAGLLVRALATGEFAGALFLVGFAALFGWQIGGFVMRNRPRAYRFDDLPSALLP